MAAADWSQQLPNDLLSLIGSKLDVVVDRCRFRSVCKSWRCSLPPFAQPPFLMLSEPEEVQEKEKVNNLPPLLRFVGVSGGGGGGEQQQQQQQQQQEMVYEIDLPEAHQQRCVGSTDDYAIGYRGIGIPGGKDMGVFNLEDKSIQLHYITKTALVKSIEAWKWSWEKTRGAR